MRLSIRHRSPTTREGFTLVELLVAAALSILIMAVMATAFQSGLQTLSTLKSLGDMAERLKTAETMLRSDLDAEHFAITGRQDDSPGIQRLSDLRYDLLTTGALQPAPPQGGYFRIRQAGASIQEGLDADGLSSTRAEATQEHQLSFTIRRRSRSPEGLFSAHLGNLQATNLADFNAIMAQRTTDVMPLDGNLYVTNWAQVDWFLDTDPARMSVLNGVPTWPLIRRVRVLGLSNTPIAVNSKPQIQDSLSLVPSLPAAATQLNTPGTVRAPANRALAQSIPSTGARYGDDIVITNVLSFEVKPMWVPAAGSGIPAPRTLIAPGQPNGDFPFDDLPPVPPAGGIPPAFPRIFDTMSDATGWNTLGNANSIPLRIRVQAVQIKIRVYDPKNKMTRQTTLVVKL